MTIGNRDIVTDHTGYSSNTMLYRHIGKTSNRDEIGDTLDGCFMPYISNQSSISPAGRSSGYFYGTASVRSRTIRGSENHILEDSGGATITKISDEADLLRI